MGHASQEAVERTVHPSPGAVNLLQAKGLYCADLRLPVAVVNHCQEGPLICSSCKAPQDGLTNLRSRIWCSSLDPAASMCRLSHRADLRVLLGSADTLRNTPHISFWWVRIRFTSTLFSLFSFPELFHDAYSGRDPGSKHDPSCCDLRTTNFLPRFRRASVVVATCCETH